MGLRTGMDTMKQGLADMMSESSVSEMLDWCRDNGLPLETDVEAEYWQMLGIIAGKLMRSGAPPATVGVYIATLMTAMEDQICEQTTNPQR